MTHHYHFSYIRLLVITILLLSSPFCKGQLQFGFYSRTCPDVEFTVRNVVQNAVNSDRNMAAVLLRLQFHDCFVEGCDGSILINNGPDSERHAFGHQGVRGFEVIETAKQLLEESCPGVVSCADIVALAARDSIILSNGPDYAVPLGRRDGVVSSVSLAAQMPDVSESINQLRSKFFQKGLTDTDLVLLSAAHTIGTTACFFMTKRLYNFFPNGGSDPSINPNFLPELRSICPPNGDVNVRLGIDHGSETTFDNQILRNIRDGFAVLESDAKLNDDFATRSILDSYANGGFLFGPSFERDFVASIVKMGQIGVNTGSQGQIRRVCSAFN